MGIELARVDGPKVEYMAGRKGKLMFLVTSFVLFLSRALPFVLDSDEEVMTTRFELSKMN